jgi:hypothetical protein
MSANPSSTEGKDQTEVVFTLTNKGDTGITVPIYLHPGDLEPSGSSTSYRVKEMQIYVTSSSGKQIDLLVPGGATLYSVKARPDTSVMLAPGQAMNIRTRVALFDGGKGSDTSRTFVGHVILYDVAITTTNGRTVGDSSELGSADSTEYSSGDLLGVPKENR